MDSNRDEADKCLELAVRLIRQGNLEKALKFIHKSQRLFPTGRASVLEERVQSLIEEKENMRNGEGDTGSQDADDGYTSIPSEHDGMSNGQAEGAKGDESHGKYTPEQKAAVDVVLSKKCFYDVLQVSKEATEIELKKSYRKLALQLHPDKNSAPRAGEAFKAVGNAFAILSDSEKRKRYDLYGLEEERVSSSRGGYHRHSHFEEFEADISPEDLFNMFFGGGFPSTHVYTFGPRQRNRRFYRQEFHRHTTADRENQPSNYGLLFNLAPLLVLIFLSFAGSLFQSDPVYSLSPSSKYSVQRQTQNLKIPYYVKSDFSESFRGKIGRLELQIEEDYIIALRHNCFKERSYKESLLWQARTYGDPYKLQRAQELKTPACDKLSAVYA
ncbi:unnamed protein product [Cyprideis torosa]|uniref:Uncharacterized protein n=1 Tax=Cyprideis torosa TaxID=163714 RepID=A0A7R8W950_9CRUS|nr:unnamed protein product [Cyprideis torosa]CAG0886968.1 unnamed protein product [Cyprideis torosa]